MQVVSLVLAAVGALLGAIAFGVFRSVEAQYAALLSSIVSMRKESEARCKVTEREILEIRERLGLVELAQKEEKA